MVDSSIIAGEVGFHHEVDRDGSSGDEGLHHDLFVAGTIVTTHVLVLTNVCTITRHVSVTNLVLRSLEKNINSLKVYNCELSRV